MALTNLARPMSHETSIKSALSVMATHIEGINAHDEAAIGETLHFPHYRLSGSGMKIWDTPDSYFQDFRARAGDEWDRSSFEDIQVVRASDTKVHFDAEIQRFRSDGRLLNSFRSLWVITKEDGRWAARLRSSFAPQ